MSPRAYNAESRRRQQAERKARIAAATAGLHAQKGVAGTSYADIARQAGVSLPTVYSHFPTQDELLRGCTAHVAARAPGIPLQVVLVAADLPAAADLLVASMERVHLHFEPWLARREDGVVPFLAAASAALCRDRTALVARVLERHLGSGSRPELEAAWESLLSFDFWHRLVRAHGLSRAAARRVIVQCLLSLAAPASSAMLSSRRRNSS